jgi:hypothetical protein
MYHESNMKTKQTYFFLLDYINSLWIIDTHEHLEQNENNKEKEVDFLQAYLKQYFVSDLKSAGLSKKELAYVVDPSQPLLDRWKIVEPYWRLAAKTGYGRSLAYTVNGLYGIDTICGDTIQELNTRFLQANIPGHYNFVLKEKSRIITSLVDQNLDCDRLFFRSVFRLEHYIYPDNMDTIAAIEEQLNTRICSFDDWLDCCEKEFVLALRKGSVALKFILAYRRTLNFERVPWHEAESCFNQFIQKKYLPDWISRPITTTKAFQDYMVHFMLRLANRKNFPVQMHTGIQEGNRNILSNSDPSLLCNIFSEYPDIPFDLFHIGYPYQNILSVLGKNFHNVFLDMCWAHIVSPAASIDALYEWLDTVPLNKISAFGGDFNTVDCVYGHQYIARENVARSLYRKVSEGIFDLDGAKEIAKRLFYENPKNLYRLTDIEVKN